MTRAIGQQELLRRIMANEAGSLDGAAASRHDLWRLAQLAVYLRAGTAALRRSGDPPEARLAAALARRLRRRMRKAMIAYARAILRANEPRSRLIVTARAAALAAVGGRGAAEAERLADIETGSGAAHTALRQGVARALIDLALDWLPPAMASEAQPSPVPTAPGPAAEPALGSTLTAAGTIL